MEKKEGTLKFSESEGKFYITNEDTQQVISGLDFGDNFEALVDGQWVPTALEIGSADNGDLIFKLKNTKYAGFIEGVTVRI
ncbi:MAG: DUF5348 domain-containing protein [Treponema sp.]|nr:DUF5348 domain-containing protein [Treponema sp.]